MQDKCVEVSFLAPLLLVSTRVDSTNPERNISRALAIRNGVTCATFPTSSSSRMIRLILACVIWSYGGEFGFDLLLHQ
jgi:hypothetical protein